MFSMHLIINCSKFSSVGSGAVGVGRGVECARLSGTVALFPLSGHLFPVPGVGLTVSAADAHGYQPSGLPHTLHPRNRKRKDHTCTLITANYILRAMK